MIKDNLAAIEERVGKACERTGRDPSEVKIMAVTKTVGVDSIKQARDAGITLFGENRVQEAKMKSSQEAFKGVQLCMIGHLQTNKASVAARVFDQVHSLDSTRAADAVSRFGAMYREETSIPVLVEVNIGRDPAKHGVLPEGALILIRYIAGLPCLRLAGLMAVAPGYGDADAARTAFRSLKVLKGSLIESGVDSLSLRELSMGMSGDFDIAVEEGSTIIRVGTALFGARS